jgi:hypothetical protein
MRRSGAVDEVLDVVVVADGEDDVVAGHDGLVRRVGERPLALPDRHNGDAVLAADLDLLSAAPRISRGGRSLASAKSASILR